MEEENIKMNNIDYESNDESSIPTVTTSTSNSSTQFTTFKGAAVLLFGAMTILFATVNFNTSADALTVINLKG